MYVQRRLNSRARWYPSLKKQHSGLNWTCLPSALAGTDTSEFSLSIFFLKKRKEKITGLSFLMGMILVLSLSPSEGLIESSPCCAALIQNRNLNLRLRDYHFCVALEFWSFIYQSLVSCQARGATRAFLHFISFLRKLRNEEIKQFLSPATIKGNPKQRPSTICCLCKPA